MRWGELLAILIFSFLGLLISQILSVKGTKHANKSNDTMSDV